MKLTRVEVHLAEQVFQEHGVDRAERLTKAPVKRISRAE
jgi:hypothetical protein